ncbi:hypothetical protein GE107_24770 [Cohnella sp. CFH 77786]|uniref:3-oxoacyl-[acyl-carrier-protein] synthase III C-terminal domain-containing protein n=1 Tax=Cohnella sp. CFH 77786 TaxID=2662265 RepID=UPI001C610E7D|nr:3-oxoacyl-[acyl-carrier-protein] synthase III C-terminal domain-containing protein [Cohnella sp. CFH 77786]MBW5449243.1 hypothetical protein [Cohnella sp. CFH 77786]
MRDPLFSIIDHSVYIPHSRITTEDAIRQVKDDGIDFWMSESAYRGNGFELVPVEQSLSLEQMIGAACTPILSRASQREIRIAAIIFACVTNRDQSDRHLFASLVGHFGLEQVPVIPLEEYGCSTVHLSFRLAEAFFAACRGGDEAILFVTADKAKASNHRSDSYMIYGDGASAALYQKRHGEGQQVFTTRMKVDGLLYDAAPERIKLYFSTFYLGIRQVVRTVLGDCGMGIRDIALIFCTNLGLQTWNTFAQVLGFPLEKFYAQTLSEEGHIHNTDILHNIDHAVKNGFLKRGDYYLTVTVGFGGYYGCSLHRYD